MAKLTSCIACDSTILTPILDLGAQPPANAFLRKEDFDSEQRYPLGLQVCSQCGHVQLTETVPPETLFTRYPYRTSTSRVMVEHFAKLAWDVQQRLMPRQHGLLLELGSGDGAFLRNFHQGNGTSFVPGKHTAIGMDPAANLATEANALGLRTIRDFFGHESAARFVEEYGHADVVAGFNVLAHTPNLQDFLHGVADVLTYKGTFIFEVPYFLDTMSLVDYPQVYSEHVSYFMFTPLVRALRSAGLHIIDVDRMRVHDGTLRCYAAKDERSTTPDVASLITTETNQHFDTLQPFRTFAGNVDRIRNNLVGIVNDLASKGQRIAGYGASAKGNVLLNHTGIGEHLDYIVDNTPEKQGFYSPGEHVPVVAPERFATDPPDVMLLLAWNHISEILGKEAAFRAKGGRVLVPIPNPIMVEPGDSYSRPELAYEV